MPTTMEGLVQLGQDLRDAIAAAIGLRADMQLLKDSTTNSATTIIQQFISRPANVTFACDLNNGLDVVEDGRGSDFNKPYKTVDFAMDRADPTRPCTIYMLTDDILRKTHNFSSGLTLIGAAKTPGALGLSFSYASRRLSVAAEASDSPIPGTGRVIPKVSCGANFATFYVDIALPDASSSLNNATFLSMAGGSVIINQANITVATAASAAKLIEAAGAQRTTVTIVNTVFGTNMPGKIFAGVAAGANPNALFSYETNITSA